MTYELNLKAYTGPIEKLLELVEGRTLGISEISLAEATDDFLKYVKQLDTVEPGLLADFIAVASRLILIKSKSLLPGLELTAEEEGDIRDLERRLALYRDLRPAMRSLSDLWRAKHTSYGRPYFLDLGASAIIPAPERAGAVWKGVFYPGEKLSVAEIASAIERIFEGIKRLDLETATVRDRIVSIEEKIQEIVERLTAKNEVSFDGMARVRPLSELIALFLAILHLAHAERVVLTQRGAFSDIIIKKQENGAAGDEHHGPTSP